MTGMQNPHTAATLLVCGLLGACQSAPPAPREVTEPASIYEARIEFPSRSADAPAELEQFGRLVGTWQCRVAVLEAGGGWHTRSAPTRWNWFYTLGGHAIQDVWEPQSGQDGKDPGSLGTNLRVFDAGAGKWQVAWTSVGHEGFDLFEGGLQGDRMVLRGEREDHFARLTFFDIGTAGFDWKYEFSRLDDGENWTEVVRIHCDREIPATQVK